MRKLSKIIASIALVGSLAACGDTPVQQALMGAGAGAGVSVISGTNPIGTALVGAAANVAYCQKFPSRC